MGIREERVYLLKGGNSVTLFFAFVAVVILALIFQYLASDADQYIHRNTPTAAPTRPLFL